MPHSFKTKEIDKRNQKLVRTRIQVKDISGSESLDNARLLAPELQAGVVDGGVTPTLLPLEFDVS